MTPEEQSLLVEIGTALLVVQSTELHLRFALQFCLPGVEVSTLETFERGKTELKKKTLGQFLEILHKRVDLDDQFEAVLNTFLDCRNTLVHRIEDIPGWNLQTPEGRFAGHQFLSELVHAGMFISRVFTGLARAWAEENGIDVAIPEEVKAVLVDIDAKYKPMVGSLFFKK